MTDKNLKLPINAIKVMKSADAFNKEHKRIWQGINKLREDLQLANSLKKLCKTDFAAYIDENSQLNLAFKQGAITPRVIFFMVNYSDAKLSEMEKKAALSTAGKKGVEAKKEINAANRSLVYSMAKELAPPSGRWRSINQAANKIHSKLLNLIADNALDMDKPPAIKTIIKYLKSLPDSDRAALFELEKQKLASR